MTWTWTRRAPDGLPSGHRVRGEQDEPADRLRRPGGRRRYRQHGGPPNVIGQKHFDLHDAITKPDGDVSEAKAQLKLCGQPNGFTYRSDRPKEVAAATALQQALSQAGIKTTLHGYPWGTYYSNFGGVPNYMHSHDIGIAFGGWAPDWPDGYGFFDFITAGDAAILPEVCAKSLLYRSPQLTNVFVQPYYGMYNCSALGLK